MEIPPLRNKARKDGARGKDGAPGGGKLGLRNPLVSCRIPIWNEPSWSSHLEDANLSPADFSESPQLPKQENVTCSLCRGPFCCVFLEQIFRGAWSPSPQSRA